MKIFNINDFWSSLLGEIKDDSMTVTAAGRSSVERAPDQETSNIIGEDSGLLFSNRFLHDEAAHKAIVKKIQDIKTILSSKFDSTEIGKKLASLLAAAESLKSQATSGKIESPKVKIDKPTKNLSKEELEELEALNEEAAEEAEQALKRKPAAPVAPANKSEKFNLQATATQLASLVKDFIKASKKYIDSTINNTEKTLNSLEEYRGETLGQIYRRVVVPRENAERGETEQIYIKISEIMNNDKFVEEVGKTAAFKELSKIFKSTSEMRSYELSKVENQGVDILERLTGNDIIPKELFHFLGELVRSKGAFTGKMGNFKITEGENGDFVINGEKVRPEDVNKKYEQFLSMLNKAAVSDKVVKYFESLEGRDDMGAVLNKYICIQFQSMLGSDLKKMNLAKVYSTIDSAFGGTEFAAIFKSIVRNMEMYAPSIEGVEKEIVRVDNNASLQIYESNGEYYVIFYYGSQPPKRFSLESIGHRGYSNYIVKSLSANRPDALQDLYKRIVTIQIRNEIAGGRVKDPKDSQYKDSKYFAQIVHEIDEEAKKHSFSQRKYWNIIRRARFVGSEGHPAYGDDPLAKFTISVNYNDSVSLFVEFIRLSEQTFKINRVDFASGDRAMATRLINTLSNKTGGYDFDINTFKNLGNLKEGQKKEVYRKISSFYTSFLSSLTDGLENQPVAPQPAAPAPTAPAAVEQKKHSKEELIKLYNEFNALSDKDKRTPAEEKRLADLTQIISDNIAEIKKIVDLHGEDDVPEFMESSETQLKVIPKEEQNNLIRRLNQLHDMVEEGKVSKKDEPKVKAEIDRITQFLVERGDFSKYRNVNDSIDKIEDNLLDLSIADANPSQKTSSAAMILLKRSPMRKEYKKNARINLDKYPHLKSYLENIYAPEFVRLVYED